MPFLPFNAAPLRLTRLLLAYNKSSGYRWSPIPHPPPPSYDRLYGVHSVLNTLRVAVAAAQRGPHHQQHQQRQPSGSTHGEQEDASPTSTAPTAQQQGILKAGGGSSTTAEQHGTVARVTSHHPHRRHLSCLYVRDFSIEGAGDGQVDSSARKDASSSTRNQKASRRSKKVIPLRYTAVRCIVSLAKAIDVPVRFVPRSELVQLCGERRNQNIVLEASHYVPHPIRRLDDIWSGEEEEGCPPASTLCPSPSSVSLSMGQASAGRGDDGTAVASPSPHSTPAKHQLLVLYLEHIIDPTNIGGILRTAFFFGVDHVVLSRDCAACTAAVSRTSTGFLEHLHVHRATVSTQDFLRSSVSVWGTLGRSGEAGSGHGASDEEGDSGRLEVVASAVVAAAGTARTGGLQGACVSASSGGPGDVEELPDASPEGKRDSEPAAVAVAAAEDVCDGPRSTGRSINCPRNVRVLLLGNEDAGLPSELLQWCTHVAHVRSPRQLRLRHARSPPVSTTAMMKDSSSISSSSSSGDQQDSVSPLCSTMPGDESVGEDEFNEASGSAAQSTTKPSRQPLSEVEKREHSLQRLARLREKEVSLNVNTATAALLTSLMAVEGELPDHASLGMVEVRALTTR